MAQSSSVSEKIDPAEPPVEMPEKPLTPAERKRLDDLAAPKKMSEAETAELEALSQRSAIPAPPPAGPPADDKLAQVHAVLAQIVAAIEGLAAQSGTLATRPHLDGIKASLAALFDRAHTK